jgi:hypothetical protein
MFTDANGGIIGCAVSGNEPCYDITIQNNVVAGSYGVAFAAFAHECGDYDTIVFRDNLAHSIYGEGAMIFPNSTSDT